MIFGMAKPAIKQIISKAEIKSIKLAPEKKTIPFRNKIVAKIQAIGTIKPEKFKPKMPKRIKRVQIKSKKPSSFIILS